MEFFWCVLRWLPVEAVGMPLFGCVRMPPGTVCLGTWSCNVQVGYVKCKGVQRPTACTTCNRCTLHGSTRCRGSCRLGAITGFLLAPSVPSFPFRPISISKPCTQASIPFALRLHLHLASRLMANASTPAALLACRFGAEACRLRSWGCQKEQDDCAPASLN